VPTDLQRAQHYRELAQKLRETAVNEPDEKRRIDLLELANQYEGLVKKLVSKIALTNPPDGTPNAA